MIYLNVAPLLFLVLLVLVFLPEARSPFPSDARNIVIGIATLILVLWLFGLFFGAIPHPFGRP